MYCLNLDKPSLEPKDLIFYLIVRKLGLKYFSISKTSNGYLAGFNSAHDPRIRNLEHHNSGYYDLRRHQGARRVRLTQLMNKHKGKIHCFFFGPHIF